MRFYFLCTLYEYTKDKQTVYLKVLLNTLNLVSYNNHNSMFFYKLDTLMFRNQQAVKSRHSTGLKITLETNTQKNKCIRNDMKIWCKYRAFCVFFEKYKYILGDKKLSENASLYFSRIFLSIYNICKTT